LLNHAFSSVFQFNISLIPFVASHIVLSIISFHHSVSSAKWNKAVGIAITVLNPTSNAPPPPLITSFTIPL
jgi:hypothetical protein